VVYYQAMASVSIALLFVILYCKLH